MISVLLLLFSGACSQPESPLAEGSSESGFWVNPDPPVPEDHFFFLPPLGIVPEYEGTFAAMLEPLVRVGIVEEDGLRPLAEFTVDGNRQEKVRQSASDGLGDFYIVNMNLKKYDVSAGMRLLIEVFVDGRKLGELPAVLIAKGADKDTVEGACPLVINRTIPIKFRIEEEFFNAPLPGSIEVWGVSGMPRELLDVPEGDDFIALALGTYHGTALREDGSLVSWGRDNSGQIAGTPDGTGFIAVDAGLLYSLALHEDGTLHIWGGGLGGKELPPQTEFSDIAAGDGFAMALNEEGFITLWSYSSSGSYPDSWPAGSGYKDIRAGTYLALAIDSANQLELFGNSTTGVLEAEIPAGSYLYADAAEFHAAGILSDGRLVSWGGGEAETHDLIQNLDDGPYSSVALGEYLGVGLRKDGTVRSFGDSSVAAEIPADMDIVVALAANQDTAVAVIRLTE